MHFTNSVTDQVINLPHLLGQRVAIVGISGETLDADEPSATTAHCHTDLVAELILFAGLALGDALNFRLMCGIDLVLVLSLLSMDPACNLQ